jgi:hypothetical protein
VGNKKESMGLVDCQWGRGDITNCQVGKGEDMSSAKISCEKGVLKYGEEAE